MPIDAVSHFMTPNPCTIERTATLTDAHGLMRAHDVRHLPVLDEGALCGIVSERDLLLVETLTGCDPDVTLVENAMTESPFIVTSDTALDDIVEIMGEQKYGSVIVMGRGGVEGIFTATDACIALAKTLRNVERKQLMADRP